MRKKWALGQGMGQLGGVFQLTLRFQLELPFNREPEPAQGGADWAESAPIGTVSVMPSRREQGVRCRPEGRVRAVRS